MEGRHTEESTFESWLAAALERVDPVMAWLGVVWALVVGYEFAVELTPDARQVLAVVGWVAWGIFLAELLAHLVVAPDRLRYLRRHPLQVVGVLVPALRILRFARLLRLGRALPAARVVTSSYRVAGTARRLLGSRLGYIAALSAVVVVALAELAYLFERDAADPLFANFGDAILWSVAVVVAQGGLVPDSLGAHVAMLAGFAWGVAVFATVAGALGAFFIDERRERAETEPQPDAGAE
ncbi:MAG TPA: ion transporter [Solirubrobacteraceae bacterium]|nr:ion transporter [Solirubrobacteraceae bacterium]